MLYEVIAALAVLGVLIALVAQMQVTALAARRGAQRRAVALQAAANVAERSQAVPWVQWTDEGLAQAGLDAGLAESLPDARLKLMVVPSDGGPVARRLDIEISWPSASGAPEPPVRLSHWAFAPPQEAAP
jgi:hypothetical protein